MRKGRKMPEGGSMSDSEIDRILSRQDEIVPSSGFAASVMEALREESAAPAPIAFPWKRALPGLVVAALVLAIVGFVGLSAMVLAGRSAISQHVASTPAPVSSLPLGIADSAAVWTVVALLTALVSVKLSIRLATGRV